LEIIRINSIGRYAPLPIKGRRSGGLGAASDLIRNSVVFLVFFRKAKIPKEKVLSSDPVSPPIIFAEYQITVTGARFRSRTKSTAQIESRVRVDTLKTR